MNQEIKSKNCARCRKDRAISNFYKSGNVLFDGYAPLCKSCIKYLVNPKDLESVKSVLNQIDKPFIKNVWEKAKESQKDTFGEYIKMVSSLPQYKNLTFKDSYEELRDPKGRDDDDEEHEEVIPDFNVTRDMIIKWGTGYTTSEYMKLESFYQAMQESHDISTPQHIELLVLVCELNVKMKRCLDKGDTNGFSKLHGEYQKLLVSSGFRPIDRKGTDESTGIRTFSQIFEEVERDGFIEPWDISVTQDIVDRTIQYMMNYQRKLFHMESLVKPPDDTPQVEVG